ncbi:MAG TPA: DUF6541 family protein [Chloroflexia bacterium]|nr:DUF6541 family protein [Chloroflexia bacterium]
MNVLSPDTLLHVLIAVAVLVLPGTAVYRLARLFLAREPDDEPLLGWIAGTGLSIALWPLFLLYLTLAGGGISWWLIWIVLAASAVVIALAGRFLPSSAPAAEGRPIAVMLVLAVVTLGALAFRLWDIQGISVPMFGDSLHHTLITRMILEGGEVPSGYQPYAPVDTFTYHFGFHTLAAVLGIAGGLDAPGAVLVMGQVLITAAVPAAYFMNRLLFSSRLAGLGAAIIVGFVSIMPAYYVNWGRYTQLAGHVLVAIAIGLTAHLMSRGFKRGDLALVAICVGGLVVVHYRVLIFYGLFGLALGAWQLISRRYAPGDLFAGWARGLAAVVIGLIVAGAWIINLSVNYFPVLAGRLRSVTPDYLAQYNNPDTVRVFAGLLLPSLALVGLALGIVNLIAGRGRVLLTTAPEIEPRPGDMAITLAIWSALLVGSLFVVPGAIGGYAVAISIYIPLAALGGYGVGQGLGWIQERTGLPEGVPASLMLALGLGAMLFMGTWHVSDPAQFQYVQESDRRAFEWVRANTPPDSRFLISSEFSYLGRNVTGTDGGMWLPILAGRITSLPVLSAWVEHSPFPDFFPDTRRLAAYTQPWDPLRELDASFQEYLVDLGIIPTPAGMSDEVVLELMRKLGITHVYSGAQEGKSLSRLDVEAMRADPVHYELVYFDGGVYIFRVEY